jgi:hypothetical protein
VDANLQKKIKRASPNKASGKQKYDQPLRVLHRGNVREDKFIKTDPRSEAEQVFYALDWQQAWQEFLERKPDGTWKHKHAHDLVNSIAVGIDEKTKKRRAQYLYSAIGPLTSSDKTKKVPWLGDWDMLRAQTFLGEMQHDNMLFGTPRMKVMREALREHIDVTHTAKDMAEVLLGWLARAEAWAKQVDEFFGYRVFDKELSLKDNQKRFADYMALQTTLRASTESTVEKILSCYGVGKDGMAVLAQLIVASKLQGVAGEHAHEMILQGLSGVETLDGKATGGGVLPEAEREVEDNAALKLLCASFADKAITYKMPHPQLNIPGVPDEDDQETPRQHIKKIVEGMLPGKKAN